ncbi:uncharacterized protein E0L32_004407 [Thyridium curvatum]|uniref:Uncharacterized protein n=1 Tax=Thyridium curvatum TaxID=1093900 RepID=A0A507B6L5_9PEZI|nr:uncharacterized protein E0L32_004407 [Thyridium curvatum]TPX15427.1 hypothetical protein E0L32_004407 [Thyridium curvatum]
MKQFMATYELSLFQRIMVIWLFVICGLFISFHIAQQWTEKPYAWARLTEKTRPYWYTFYVFEAFLTVQILYRILEEKMAGALNGLEMQVLDSVWIGLLGVEVLMVIWAGGVTVMRSMAPQVAQAKKTQ